MRRFRLSAGSRTPSSVRIAGQRSMRMVRSFKISCQWREKRSGRSSTSCSGVESALQSESRRRASDSASRTVCAGASATSPILKPARSVASHISRRTGSMAGRRAPPSAAIPRISGVSSSTSPIGSIRGSRLAPAPLVSRKAARRASAARRDGTRMVAAARSCGVFASATSPVASVVANGMPAGIEWM